MADRLEEVRNNPISAQFCLVALPHAQTHHQLCLFILHGIPLASRAIQATADGGQQTVSV